MHKNPTGSDRKWPLSSFICFGKKFLKFFFENLYCKFFRYFFYKCPIFSPIWVVFWYIQGAEVELVLVNSTSSPCTYQKNVSGVFRMKYLYRIFQKPKKNATKKKFKISLKIEFLLKMPFLVISGHFRWGFFTPQNCLKSVL